MYNNWIKKGLAKGLSDIEVYATNKTHLSIEVYEGSVEKNVMSSMEIALVKGIYKGKAAKVKIEDYSDAHVDQMLDRLIDAASNITADEPALIYEGSKSYAKVRDENFDFMAVDPNAKIDLLLKLEKGILANKYVTKTQAIAYSESDSKTTIVNSKGLNLTRHHTYATVFAVGVYQQGEQIKTGLSYQLIKDFNDINLDKLISDNIKEGTDQLGAKPIKSGTYPVVFSNERFGDILGVFTSLFTGEAAFRNVTKLKDLVGKEIASKNVNLLDDPLNEKAHFMVPFDDEGVACQKRYWIKDGVFTGFAHNLKTAEIFKTTSTGNGFVSGIDPTNLLLEPDNISFDNLIKDIKDGLYITDLVGLHAGVETTSGDFSLQASGFRIVDGKLDTPVDMIVVSGNFFKLLKNIEGSSNDFIFGLSGIGSGSVKVKSLTIGGE